MELNMVKLKEILDDSYQRRCYIVVDCDYDTLNRFFETVIPVLWPWWSEGRRPEHPYAHFLWDTYIKQYRPNDKKLSIIYNSINGTLDRFGYCDDAYFQRQKYTLYPKTLSQIIAEVQLQIDADILDLL